MVHLQERVIRTLNKHRLLERRQRILVAVSGGVDSMVLLHVLKLFATEQRWKITVAHVNHQLRGTSSMEDERLVRRTAQQMKLPVVVLRADVQGFAKQQGISLEMAARRIRHDFLALTARRRRIPCIALAHHQGDQLEHFFLRLLRGSGGQGLGGMKSCNVSPSDPDVILVRPLLDCSKEELREYAAQARVKFREDSTNNSLDIQRNRIRHELLPLLKRHYQPALAKNLLRVMSIVGAESDHVGAEAEHWLRLQRNVELSSTCKSDKTAHSELAKVLIKSRAERSEQRFEDLPIALQRRILQLQLLSNGIRAEYELIEHLRQNPEDPVEISNTKVGITSPASSGKHALVKAPVVRLVRKGTWIENVPGMEDFRPGYRKVQLWKPGTINWGGVKVGWRVEGAKGLKRSKMGFGNEVFDADAVGEQIIIRHWRPGDRFQPIGMKCAIKLQDLFVNQKLDRGERRRRVLGTTGRGEIFWVEGIRISERFKLTSQTIRRLHWAWQRL